MEYGAGNVLCPFYKGETRNTIKCEGVISSTCSNNFSMTKTKKEHYEEYCCGKYKVLERKYYEQLSD